MEKKEAPEIDPTVMSLLFRKRSHGSSRRTPVAQSPRTSPVDTRSAVSDLIPATHAFAPAAPTARHFQRRRRQTGFGYVRPSAAAQRMFRVT